GGALPRSIYLVLHPPERWPQEPLPGSFRRSDASLFLKELPMTSWRKAAHGGVLTMIVMWCVVAAQPLGAQQRAGGDSLTRPSASAATVANAPLPGPRLNPEWRRVEPGISDRSPAGMPSSDGTHTLRMS